MHFDLPLDELRSFRPDVAEPDDFDRFWSNELAAADAAPLDVTLDSAHGVIRSAEVFDVRFTGHGGNRVAAWLLVPRHLDPAAPVVVEFIGYGGGRGRPVDWLNWSSAGFPHLVVDSRGQGGGWRSADTPDPGDAGEPGARNFLARGLSGPAQHYYCGLFVDAARSMSVPAAVPRLAGRSIVAVGGSQGGALALAAANLSAAAAAVAPDVPFLAHVRRAASLTDAAPYSEIADYCKTYPDRVEQVFHTLSYFDVVNHGRRLDRPALFSVGLVDLITPPSTVFAAFNHYGGELHTDKQIDVYEFNGHEGGGSLHFERKVRFIHDRIG